MSTEPESGGGDSPDRGPRTSNVLPGPQEAARVAFRPDSYSHRFIGDVRLYLSAGYALLLQVAHPTVGSGVRDHSTFATDPWGRLLRTMDYLYLFTLTGPDAAAMGERLREMHKTIKGANPDGSRYHALEPEAYAWVHATLIESIVRSYRMFVGRLSDPQAERMYGEWVAAGRLLGVRPGDLPDTWREFEDYFDEMVDQRLVHHETVDQVLTLLEDPDPPPIPMLEQLWPLLKIAPARAVKVTTIGLLPPALRERFGVEWDRRMARDLRLMSRTSRALTPVIPDRMLEIGERHLRWRSSEIANGPLGDGTPPVPKASPRRARRAEPGSGLITGPA